MWGACCSAHCLLQGECPLPVSLCGHLSSIDQNMASVNCKWVILREGRGFDWNNWTVTLKWRYIFTVESSAVGVLQPYICEAIHLVGEKFVCSLEARGWTWRLQTDVECWFTKEKKSRKWLHSQSMSACNNVQAFLQNKMCLRAHLSAGAREGTIS